MRTHSKGDAARLAAVLAGLVLLAAVPVGLAAEVSGPSGPGSPAANHESLEARVNGATLELYALETKLARAREAVSALSARREELARERASVQERLGIAHGALRLSQARLAQIVRALYEQTGNAEPLAIILGAESFEEALIGLDSLSRAAGETDRVIGQARVARRLLTRLDARLAARDAELRRLADAARGRAAELAAAAAARKGYVAGLRRLQGIDARRVAAIERVARVAQAKTAELTPAAAPAQAAVAAAASAEARAPAAGTDAPTAAAAPGDRVLTVSSTGYALRGRTATGIFTAPGVVAVDPSVIPLGTRLTIPGYGEGTAADTGGAVHGNEIDLWFPTVEQALQWGRRTVTIVIHQ